MSTKHAPFLFISSFTKLALIVYPLSQVAEATFRASGHSITPFVAWLGLLAFALQAYMISSAVSDLAVAIADYRGKSASVKPFEASYRSHSVSEFWNRWLGWQHPDHAGPYTAIGITAVVAAIYIGPSESQLAWAVLMTGLVACEQRWFSDRAPWHKLPRPLATFTTFLVLLLGWGLLRSTNFEHAWHYARALFGQNELTEAALILEAQAASDSNLLLVILSLIIVIVLPPLQSLLEPVRPWKRALAALPVAVIAIYAVVPPARAWVNGQFASLLSRGSTSVFVGRGGWLYDQRELRALTGSGALDQELGFRLKPRSLAPEAIIRFTGQLKDRGVPLLIIPIPMKAAIYPEYITGTDPEESEAPLYHACQPPLYEQLTKAGADVQDITAAMLQLKERKKPVFHKQDSRWTPDAMQVLAKAIADHVRKKYPGAAAGNPMIIDAKAQEASGYGDLATRLHVDSPYGGYAQEQALLLSFPTITNDPSSPVVLMGDDFARIYDDPALGFTPSAEPSRASFAEHLALYLGRNIDTLAQVEGSATAVRRQFADRLDDDVRAKKMVIWLLPVRDLIAPPSERVDWSDIRFNEAKRPPQAILPMVPRP